MMIPDDILKGDRDCVLMDWGVAATAQVVTIAGEPPEETVTESTVMVVVSAVNRLPSTDNDPDIMEMTLTTPHEGLPVVPEGATLRWQYDGHRWEVRQRRNLPGEMVTVFVVRRAD